MDAISRRRFVQSALGQMIAGSMVLQRRRSFAAESSDGRKPAAESVNFGFSLYGMRSLPVNDAIKVCADIGYDSVELVATAGWPSDPEQVSPAERKELRSLLADQKMAVPGIMENLQVVVSAEAHSKNLDRLKRAAELGHDVSPTRPPVLETILGGRPEQWDELKGKLAEGLRNWAKMGQSTETIIAIKAHISGALYRPADAKWLVDEVDSPWLKLVYDYSHFQLGGFELEPSLESMIDDTVFIHVKDSRGKPPDFQFLLPGEGNIDYPAYFRLLGKRGYRGGIVVEVSGQIHGRPGYDPIAAAKKSYANIAQILSETGLRKPR